MMFDFFFFFQLAALLICLIFYKKLIYPYKYFAPFLFLIALFELGTLLDWFNINHSNTGILNLFSTVEFIFYSLIIYVLIKNVFHKAIFFYTLIFTLVFTLSYLIFLKDFNTFNTYTFSLQAFVIITSCCMYFFYKIQDARNEILIIKEPTFWLYTGLLFYYLGGFLFFASYSHMVYKGGENFLILYKIVTNVSNIILYSCLIKLFLCFRQAKI